MLPSRRTKRRAASLLEIILGLPVILMLLFAVAQFGLLQSNQQSLKQASRAGALVAAELNITQDDSIHSEIIVAVNEVLRKSGLLGSAESIANVGGLQLNHNLGGKSVKFIGMACNPPQTTIPLDQASQPIPYVQVTVSMEATRLAPNTMGLLGVDFNGRYVAQTSLYRHELSP